MSPSDLPRFEDPACASCRGMRPDCYVGEHALCWVCAHAVQAHGMAIGAVPPDCTCSAESIFPADVLALRRRLVRIVSGEEDRSQIPAVSEAPQSNPTSPDRTFSTFSPSYDERGRRDPDGPVLVQTFRRLDESRIELIKTEVRPRIKRVQRAQRMRGLSPTQVREIMRREGH